MEQSQGWRESGTRVGARLSDVGCGISWVSGEENVPLHGVDLEEDKNPPGNTEPPFNSRGQRHPQMADNLFVAFSTEALSTYVHVQLLFWDKKVPDAAL